MGDTASSRAVMFRVDLHNHTVYSGDSTLEPEEAVQRAVELGLDGIAFTEHNTLLDPDVAGRLREKYAGLLVIISGVEYSSKEGHILVFGCDNAIIAGLGRYAPAGEVIRLVSGQGGVVVPSHPFRSWSEFKGEISALQGIAAIEAYNGHNMDEENDQAVIYAGRYGLSTTGGSDSHDVDDVGRCYTEFLSRFSDEGGFLEELKAGRMRGVKRLG